MLIFVIISSINNIIIIIIKDINVAHFCHSDNINNNCASMKSY